MLFTYSWESAGHINRRFAINIAAMNCCKCILNVWHANVDEKGILETVLSKGDDDDDDEGPQLCSKSKSFPQDKVWKFKKNLLYL